MVYGISVFGVSLRLSRVFMLLIIPIVLFKIIFKPSLIIRDKFLVFGIIPFILFSTLSLSWTPTNSIAFGFNRLASLYEVMFVYVIFAVADLNVLRFKSFIKYYLLSSLIPLGISFWQIANNLYQFSSSELPFQNLLIEDKYEVLRERFALTAEGVSRISSTFAEPSIFGSFMCSVLLLSLSLDAKNKLSMIALRIFQFMLFLCMVLSLSKLAILIFTVAIIVMLRKQKMYLISFISGFILIVTISSSLLSYYNLDLIAKRFFIDTGHIVVIESTITELENINLMIGDGIGSIPALTTNKFLLSRIYEAGAIGLMFALYVSTLPLNILYMKVYTYEFNKLKNICVGVIFAVLFGLHAYDYFIYIWPWMVIGAIMSLRNNVKYKGSVKWRNSMVHCIPVERQHIVY